jgi:hypothetical protein
MSYHKQSKRYGADKIFLLALFAFSLFIAYLIVGAKRTIVLGKAAEIPRSGVSVRLPNGNGWQCDTKWEHNENALVLRSVFRPSPQETIAEVVCTYQLASFRDSARAWLEQYAAELGAANPEYGTQQAGTTPLEWVYAKQAQQISGVLAATAPLGHGRWLDIEIIQMTAEDDVVRSVFEKMARNMVISDNQLLGKGVEIVSRLKADGLDKAIVQQDEPYYYLVKDSSNRDLGFAIEAIVKSGNAGHTEVQAAGFGYITRPNRWESAMLFKGNPGLDEYVWEGETEYRKTVRIRKGPLTIQGPEQNIRISTRVSVSGGDRISVHRLGDELEMLKRGEATEYQARISEAAVPSAVIEAVYFKMVNSGVDKIMVDVIADDGQVEPAVITVKKAPEAEPQVSHIVKTEYVGTDKEEETYLDGKIQIVKKILRQNGLLVLEPAAMEELLQRFPERADYILQRSQAIKQGRL